MDLVHERLSRDDALSDLDCIRRLEESTQFGPLLGFAFQLLEAARLSEAGTKAMKELQRENRWPVGNSMSRKCAICGESKRAFHT